MHWGQHPCGHQEHLNRDFKKPRLTRIARFLASDSGGSCLVHPFLAVR
jgi:hypothetical protein